MTEHLWQRRRSWRPVGMAMGLVIGASSVVLASDLCSAGDGSCRSLTIENPFVHGASPATDTDVVEPESVAAPPIYRLPMVDQLPTTRLDESDDSASEPRIPPVSAQSPSSPLKCPAGCDVAGMRRQDSDASRRLASRGELGLPPSEVEKRHNGVFQQDPSQETAGPLPTEPGSEIRNDPEADRSDESESAWATEPNAATAASSLIPYAPTTAELSRQLLPKVHKAFGLAQHGAVYAAQTEFIQVLRRVVEARDAAEGVDTHARALAAGLRALDEADDFAPQGTQLEADLNVAAITSAHRTPALHDEGATTRPAKAIALYHQFARQQLAAAVAGEQAGSMALYGLGKVQIRLARAAEGGLQHQRKALTMYLAALDAGPGNHLAANEIGVLLSRGGHPEDAAAFFRWAIDFAPTSTSYHNLAVVERTLGYHEQAAANEQYAQQLAMRDRAAGAASRASGVQWVAPQELSHVARPLPIEANQDRVTTAPQRLPPPAAGPLQTIAKWPQKLVPGIFRR